MATRKEEAQARKEKVDGFLKTFETDREEERAKARETLKKRLAGKRDRLAREVRDAHALGQKIHEDAARNALGKILEQLEALEQPS